MTARASPIDSFLLKILIQHVRLAVVMIAIGLVHVISAKSEMMINGKLVINTTVI